MGTWVKGRLQRRWSYPAAERTLRRQALNPTSFTQKIYYKMAYDRRPLLTTLADKVEVRTYVRDRIGDDYLSEVYGVYEVLPETRPTSLPANYVVKANHCSGASVFVWDQAPREQLPSDLRRITWERFFVHPDTLDWGQLKKLADKWIHQNFFWAPGRLPEWAYRDIPPRIMFEELFEDAQAELPSDYKFFMFDGECQLIQHDSMRFSGHLRDMYSPTWDRLPIRYLYRNSLEGSQKPNGLDEMLKIARALSDGIDFVRVDLYETDKGVKFGEMTNYPDAGFEQFDPESFDLWLGSKWQLPEPPITNDQRGEK
jgi:hypothetical protein